MKWLKALAVFIVLGGIALVAVLKAPAVYGQRDDVPDRRARELTMLAGRGSALGVTVRDVRSAEAGGDRTTGVLIDEVRPGSPADKAGLAREIGRASCRGRGGVARARVRHRMRQT